MQNLTLNKFDQYIIRQFWIILSIAILGFLSIFIIVDLIENIKAREVSAEAIMNLVYK